MPRVLARSTFIGLLLAALAAPAAAQAVAAAPATLQLTV
jgi:hypothetical protein